MANNQNLKPVKSKEEAREKGRIGGIKSGQVRREKKRLKEQMELLLSLPMVNGKNKNKLKSLGLDDKEINNKMAINYALFTEALKGNVKAYEAIQNTIGEKPNGNDLPQNEINKNINNIADLINNPKNVRTEEDLNNE